MEHKILELYSGIGGMHCAWMDSGLPGEITTAVDINTVANEVYKFNFPNTKLLNRNIQSLGVNEIKMLNINTIVMSPPCQPFSRNGKRLDLEDARTASFIHLISIIEQLDHLEYILMENVKGFECSAVRDRFIEKLEESNFQYQEFLLCPTSVGIPNSRLRYYCIARRCMDNRSWPFRRKDGIMKTLPKSYQQPYPLKEILDGKVSDIHLVPEKLLKRANILDICYPDSRRSCCFTKAYTHYIEGTGSVFTSTNEDMVTSCYNTANKLAPGSKEFIAALKPLRLRFFTPKEVTCLMSFPKCYKFPENVTVKQCYRLLGNSVNVKVISELIKILFS